MLKSPESLTPIFSQVKGHLNKELLKAVKLNSKEKCIELLDKGASPCARFRNLSPTNPQAITALMHASRQGSLELCALLLERGANIDDTLRGRTAMMKAARYGHTAVCAYLLSQNANLNTIDDEGATALSLACQHKHQKTVLMLLEKGADTTAAIKNCLRHHNMDYFKILINHSIVNGKNPVLAQSLLTYACAHSSFEHVKLLIEHGANIDIADENGKTALMASTQNHQDGDIFRYLINKKVNLNAKDNKGRNALMIAAISSGLVIDVHYFKSLIKLGVDADLKDDNGLDALMLHWTQQNYVHCFHTTHLLVNAKKDYLTDTDSNGNSIIMLAVSNYLKSGLNLCYEDFKDTLQLFINRGADVNAANNNGETPLIIAAREGKFALCELLMSLGADLSLKTNSDKCATIELLNKISIGNYDKIPNNICMRTLITMIRHYQDRNHNNILEQVRSPDECAKTLLFLAALWGEDEELELVLSIIGVKKFAGDVKECIKNLTSFYYVGQLDRAIERLEALSNPMIKSAYQMIP